MSDLINTNIESVLTSLKNENYDQLMSSLRQLGRPIVKQWKKEKTNHLSERLQLTSDPEFKTYLLEKLESGENLVSIQTSHRERAIQELIDQLSSIKLLIIVWKDREKIIDENPTEVSESQPETTTNKKWLRQQIKFKSSLDKSDIRHPINAALQLMIIKLCQQSDQFIENSEWAEQFKQSESKQDLLELIFNCIEKLNEKLPDSNDITADPTFDSKLEQVEKMGKAIKAFDTPTIKKKLLKYFGISLALLAALACGLATGGAIYLLVPSLPILGYILGGVIGIWGFTSNYNFFSQNFPEFLLNLSKKGGISEYFNQDGERQQLSPIKKRLLIPLAVIASITVGLGTSAITYTTIIALAAKLVPALAIIWPPLPIIIAAILALAIGITLTVAVLTATIKSIKDSENFSWAQCKEALQKLTVRQVVGYVLKGILVVVGLFGLAYFRYTAGIDLTQLLHPLMGSAAAITTSAILSVIAFIPQAFFTIVSLQKFLRVFSFRTAQQANSLEESISPSRSFFSRLKSRVTTVYTWVALIGNAFGNAALVIVDRVSGFSISGAVGSFLNSISGNLIEPDRNVTYRNQANKALAQEFHRVLIPDETPSSSVPPTTRKLNRVKQSSGNLTNLKEPSKKARGRLSRSQSNPNDLYSSYSSSDDESSTPIESTAVNTASFYKLPNPPSNDLVSNPNPVEVVTKLNPVAAI